MLHRQQPGSPGFFVFAPIASSSKSDKMAGMNTITHQHRAAVVIPGDDAGEFAIRVLLPHAADRLIEASYVRPETRPILRAAADQYRAEYADTGLMAGGDSTPGRSGKSTCRAMERMGAAEMGAWRAHNRSRARVPPNCRDIVDSVVLWDMEHGISVSLLIAGLMALAVHYGLTRAR